MYKLLGTHIYFAMRKYGIENFTITPICSVPDYKNLNGVEIMFVKEYNSFHDGYNMTEGGGSLKGFEHSEETKHKMSIGMSGEKHPKFKGYYRTPFGKLSHVFGIKDYTDMISPMSIYRWCKNPDKKITRHMIGNSKYLSEYMFGKTFRDVGFWFESNSF